MRRAFVAGLLALFVFAGPVQASTLTFSGKATSSRSFVAYVTTATAGDITVTASGYRVRSGTTYQVILQTPATLQIVCGGRVVGTSPVACTAVNAPAGEYEILFTAFGETTDVTVTVVEP